MTKPKYKHERIISPKTLARRGKNKYRSIVTKGGDVLRIAFPHGKRRQGSGELQAILHRRNPMQEIDSWKLVYTTPGGHQAQAFFSYKEGALSFIEERNLHDRVLALIPLYVKRPEKIKPGQWVYVIDLDERGEFRAHVDSPSGKTVFEIDGFEIFEDGFMRHSDDVAGLEEYLKELKIMPHGASLHREGGLR